MVEACIFLMNNINFTDLISGNRPPVAEIKNTQINIGTGQDQTIAELAELIKGVIGFKGNLEWDSSKPDGTPRKLLDVSRINRLGWKEKTDLRIGIEMVYNNFVNL
jgi:GDP-L-fucose synthase